MNLHDCLLLRNPRLKIFIVQVSEEDVLHLPSSAVRDGSSMSNTSTVGTEGQRNSVMSDSGAVGQRSGSVDWSRCDDWCTIDNRSRGVGDSRAVGGDGGKNSSVGDGHTGEGEDHVLEHGGLW